MNFEQYLIKMLNKYLEKKICLCKYDSLFEEYNNIIQKQEEHYLYFANKIEMELFDEHNINELEKHFKAKNMFLDDTLNDIFLNYISKIRNSNANTKYYFKIREGDIDLNNLVDSDCLIFIVQHKIDFDISFGYFIKKYNKLKEICQKIEKEIFKEYNIKIKILFSNNLLVN